MIAVQGSIQTRNYEDKDGNKRTAVEIVADRVFFCGSKAETDNQVQTAVNNTTEIQEILDDTAEGLPF